MATFESGQKIMNEEGRNRMIHELRVAQTLFGHAERAIEVTFQPVREKYGITDEWLRKHEQEWLKDRQIEL